MRCFIAITLPDSILKQLENIQSSLKKYNADISWTNPKGIHLTLKFLGEISETQIIPIKEIVQEIASQHKSFQIGIRGTGVFPDERRPRVLWVGLSEGVETLSDLANQVDDKVSNLGFPKEERKFNPHLTLGRVRNPKNLQEVMNKFLHEISPDLGLVKVDHITLYQSILKPTGAEYLPLAQSPLL